MPGLLNASETLLNAIFQATNKLHWSDRQLIIRFLGGETLQDTPMRPGNTLNGYVCQILLNEDRRSELRPSQRNQSIDLNGEVPTTDMKSYTIVDQIIFEMDYQTGCWRKLRRRIRISDKRNRTASSMRRSHTTRNRRQDENGNVLASDYADLMDVSNMASEFITQNSSVQAGQASDGSIGQLAQTQASSGLTLLSDRFGALVPIENPMPEVGRPMPVIDLTQRE